MGRFIGVIISFILVALFAFALMNGAIEFASENNLNQSIADKKIISDSFSNLNSNLSNTKTITDQRNATENEVISEPDSTFILYSIVSSGATFISTTVRFMNTLFVLIATTTGIPTLVLGTISSIIVLVMVLLSYKLIKQGE